MRGVEENDVSALEVAEWFPLVEVDVVARAVYAVVGREGGLHRGAGDGEDFERVVIDEDGAADDELHREEDGLKFAAPGE